MKIYVSGPMTGIPDNNRDAFNKVAERLRKAGHDVVNPAEFPESDAKYWTWERCLRRDIKQLVTCNVIYLLKGWQNSRGAKLELHIARELGFKVIR